MMDKCVSCGMEIEDDLDFCDNCLEAQMEIALGWLERDADDPDYQFDFEVDDDEITIYELNDFQIKITDDIEDGVFLDVSRKGKRIIESWYYEDTRPEQLESTVKDLFFLIDAAREEEEDDG